MTSPRQEVTSSRQDMTSSRQEVGPVTQEVIENKPEMEYVEPEVHNFQAVTQNTQQEVPKLNEQTEKDFSDSGPVDFEQLIDGDINKTSPAVNLIAPKPKKAKKVTVSLEEIIERDMNQKAIEKAKLEAILKVTPRTTPKSSPGQSPHKSDGLKLSDFSLSKMLNARLTPLQKDNKDRVRFRFIFSIV